MKICARTLVCILLAALAIGSRQNPGYALSESLGNQEPMATPAKKPKPKAARAEASISAKKKDSGDTVSVLDVMQVSVNDPARGVKKYEIPRRLKKVHCDVLIVGGGTGGAAAALSAAKHGARVCLTEETDWLGGQMTAQGVSALDENYLVETSGANRSYQQLRTAIRCDYLSRFQPTAEEAKEKYLNPGNCWVSRLSFEPLVGLKALTAELQPYIDNGQLSIYQRYKAVRIKKSGNKISSVTAVNLDNGDFLEFDARFFLDATELGDVLPLAHLYYRSGSEATREAHAPEKADPENVQDFVFPFAIEFRPGEKNTIAKPAEYDAFNAENKFSFQGYKMFQPVDLVDAAGSQIQLLPFWTYRRLIDRSAWITAPYEHDLAMINWDSNDLRGQNIIDKPPDVQAARLAKAKSLSLSFLYWLQTQAPRDEGGTGYPELLLRPEVMGTADGLSKYPYIRESRRINAMEIIREQDIAEAKVAPPRARLFADSVGIGLYPIDIHGYQEIPGAGQSSRPFQVPLGSLIPQDCKNLLAAAKNIGTTHITNGAYRLHPVEWAIGEAAGTLAALCAEHNLTPQKVLADQKRLRQLQWQLVLDGVPIYWYSDVATTDADFAGIQFLAISGLMLGDEHSLAFRPSLPVTRAEAAGVLAHFLQEHPIDRDKPAPPDVMPDDPLAASICTCTTGGVMGLDSNGNFRPEDQLTWTDLAPDSCKRLFKQAPPVAPADQPVSRGDFAAWAAQIATQPRFMGKF